MSLINAQYGQYGESMRAFIQIYLCGKYPTCNRRNIEITFFNQLNSEENYIWASWRETGDFTRMQQKDGIENKILPKIMMFVI